MTEFATFRLEQFEDYLHFERGLAHRTVVAYRGDVIRMVEFLRERGRSTPESVEHTDLRDYLFHLKDAELAATTIRRVLSSVRGYFRFLVEEGVLESDPTERLDSPQTWRTLPDVLSKEEVVALLESPERDHPFHWRDRAILELLYATGVRVSELATLPLSQLDLASGLCVVRGKGSKERVVPFGATAGEALERYLRQVRPELDEGESEGKVFLNRWGRPLSRMGLWKLVRSAAIRSGMDKDVSPHTLRHTYATHLLEGGADLAAVQELLGHADISTTQIYTHVDREYLHSVHRRFHPRS